MFVKVTRSKPGVLDGTAYPRTIEVGEVISGDLAAVFFKEQWAVECDENGAAVQTDTAVAMTGAATSAQAAAEPEKAPEMQPAPPAVPQVPIPEDWKAMKWFALQALAKKIAEADVDTPDGARVIIEAEIVARAKAQS